MKELAISGLMRHMMSCSTCWIPAFGLLESKSRGLRNVVDCNAYKCYSSDEYLLMMTTALMLK